ncbi:YheC/YheD family protein [Ammoniphilus sp. YIM 78166]|uniref:YheC/YheD family protein n=1 Tax=Ammoniphilus sp. YIM 78166 TaxID=1644106 RepID=UPI00106FABA0|nr:YheC/YheD family protein [Ammoniphilus sp. YIM 78166]
MPSRREVYVLDKWKKQRILMKDSKASSHIPQTCLFEWKPLYDYLDQYQDVYVKPIVGSGGRGIIRISRVGEDQYRLQAGTNQKHLHGQDELKRKLQKRLKGKGTFMLQQGIDLLRVEGKPVDFRALLLKPEKKWEYMGVMGKQAAKDKMVTNHCQGGKALTLSQSLKRSGMDEILRYKQVKEDMKKLALAVARTISEHYPHVRQLGLDLALDKQGMLWVLEANTKPGFKLFQKHNDRTLYPRIYRAIRSIRNQYPFDHSFRR